MTTLDDYAARFARLRVNTARAVSPHKPCLLLAVIDLAEAGALEENRIYYRPELIERFEEYFDVVRGDRDRANAYFPFFHLRGDRFWRLEPLAGRAPFLDGMRTARSHSDILANIDHAKLDEGLHALLLRSDARRALRETLISRWFPDRVDRLWEAIGTAKPVNEAEHQLRAQASEEWVVGEPAPVPARSVAFRRLVLQIYDYRCAATGWRLLVPGTTPLVEAAHLIPFSESRSDDPRNGLALTPTYHDAMDRHLIAPGPDMKWHVSDLFDERIPDHQPLVRLGGADVIFHGDRRYLPTRPALEWRLAHLMRR